MKNVFYVINLPTVPHRKYKNNGWVNWQSFLGYDTEKEAYSNREYINYDEAKKWAVLNEIKGSREWVVKGSRIHKNLPSQPSRTYKDKWNGWHDFLGKEKTS